MHTIDPSTGKKIKSYAQTSRTKVDDILKNAQKSFLMWRSFSFKDRGFMFKQVGGFLRTHEDRYASLMALEMGKPLSQGKGEIEKCAQLCDFYADYTDEFLSDHEIKTDAVKSYVTYDPLGIILAVMPWNFPFWQVFRCAVPAMMAGNAVILKHASNVCGCAIEIENIFKEIGFPRQLFSNVIVPSEKVKDLIEHPLIAAVSLTGSTQAGKSIATHAGGVLKKCVLELGGSDPYIVLEDADIDHAVSKCVASRMINAGQSCISAKRFIIVDSAFKEFEEKFVSQMQLQRMGLPTYEGIDLGPLARHDLRDSLQAQVQKSINQGARLILGGKIPDDRGAFYPPTVLTNVKSGMVAYTQELFGPVASLLKVKDEKEAIKVANDTVFGLGSAIFTGDLARAERLSHELEAGACFVNDLVRSDQRLPFGGIKQSGYGRELSRDGIKEFVNIKTVYIK